MSSKSEQTKAHIMRVAVRSFTERGYAGTALRDISTEAGVNMGLIRYHFGSKADLYRDTLAYLAEPYNEACLAALREAQEAHGGAEECLYAWLAAPYTHWDESSALVSGDEVLGFLNKMGYEEPDLTREVYESHYSFALSEWQEALRAFFPSMERGDWLWCFTALRGMYFNVVAHNDFTLWGLPAIQAKEAALHRLAADALALFNRYDSQ